MFRNTDLFRFNRFYLAEDINAIGHAPQRMSCCSLVFQPYRIKDFLADIIENIRIFINCDVI